MELHHLLFEHIMPFWEVAINDPMERFPKTLGLIDQMSKILPSDGEDEDKWEKKANLMKDQINEVSRLATRRSRSSTKLSCGLQ